MRKSATIYAWKTQKRDHLCVTKRDHLCVEKWGARPFMRGKLFIRPRYKIVLILQYFIEVLLVG